MNINIYNEYKYNLLKLIFKTIQFFVAHALLQVTGEEQVRALLFWYYCVVIFFKF